MPVGLWYTHRQVDMKLRIAERFADRIFTASAQSFRISSKKVSIVGHGIDTHNFVRPESNGEQRFHTPLEIVSVGRITPIKNLETLIDTVPLLEACGVRPRITLVGEAGPSERDASYRRRLLDMIAEKRLDDRVRWVGTVPNTEIAPYYWSADILVNLCPTGGVDKVVLEAMASRTPVLVSNRSFEAYFGPYADRLLFKERDSEDLARAIRELIHSSDMDLICSYLEKIVRERADVGILVERIFSELNRHGTG